MTSLTIARVRGIPVRLSFWFLLVLPLFAWLMARAYFTEEGATPDTWGWVWGAALAVGLFASVLLHEFAHSFAALKEGITVRSITLLPIGGVSAFEELPTDPKAEFKITVVGPLTNFVLGIPLLVLVLLDLVPEILPRFDAFIAAFAYVNVAVGLFNLLVPAFPMDGGRILRSLLATRMGRVQATRYASMVGRGLAVLMGIFGLLTFGTGGWLLLLIAFFIFTGATEEERATRITETLARFRIRDIMTRGVDTLAEDETIERAFGRMLETKHTALPIVAREDPRRVLGVATLERMREVPDDRRWDTPVRDIATSEYATLRADAAATDASKLLSRAPGPAMVLDDAGHLQGIVTPTDIIRIAQIAEAEATGRRKRGAAGPG